MNELLGLCSGTFSDTDQIKQNQSNQESNMTELLGLCSGKFTEKKTQENEPGFTFQKGSSFRIGSMEDKNKDDMNELLGLCSGRFTGQSSNSEDSTKKDTGKSMESKESGIFSAQEKTSKKSRSKQGLSAMFDAMADENDTSGPNIEDAVALCSGIHVIIWEHLHNRWLKSRS